MADRFETPPDVLDYFRQKNLRPRFSWLDVWGQEHAHAFTVAKAVETDVLLAFRNSLDRALSKGQTFENWQADIEQELRKIGWWRPRKVRDPDMRDRAVEVDFRSRRRLETIFNSNVRAARAAGQWERMQRTKAALPYILYVRTAAAEPRPEHLQWAGTILPVDHPFWNTHFPPNGWGCKCTVRQLTRAEAQRRGGVSSDPDVPTKAFRNRRTGEVTRVPEGIDPGWHTNPGRSRAATLLDRLGETLERAGPDQARRQIARLWASDTPDILSRIAERFRIPVAVAPGLQDALDAQGALVSVSNDTINRKTEKHRRDARALMARLDEMLAAGQIADEGQHARRSVILNEDGRWWRIVIARSARGFLYVSTAHRIDARRARRILGEDAAGRE